jgi:predicted nucleic acid-binding protein
VERALTRSLDTRIVAASLDAGESEAISLALEMDTRYLLLDDRRGRLVARRLGLPVTGTLGVLRLAKRRGVIVAIRPHVEALEAVGFHMTPVLLAQVLADSGEAD